MANKLFIAFNKQTYILTSRTMYVVLWKGCLKSVVRKLYKSMFGHLVTCFFVPMTHFRFIVRGLVSSVAALIL